MKALNVIQNSIKTIDGYKKQFVSNDKPNLLIVDACLKTYDYYSSFLPGITMFECDACNLAFTNIRKFIQDSVSINLSDMEIKWADTIVFPFSTMPLFNDLDFRTKIKEINPKITIVYNVEVDFTNIDFLKQLKKDLKIEATINEIKSKIIEHQKININQSDIVISHSNYILEKTEKNIPGNKSKLKLFPICNDQEFVRQGLKPEMSKTIFRDLKEIKVYVEFSSLELENNFIENVLEKSPDNIVFYSRSKNNKFIKLKPTTITHKYKELYMYNFDYYILETGSEANNFLNCKIGELLDAAMFGAVPIITSSNFKNHLKKYHASHDYITYLDNNQVLEFIQSDYETRISNANKTFKKVENHLISEKYLMDVFALFFPAKKVLNEEINASGQICSSCETNVGEVSFCEFEKDVHDREVECNCCAVCRNKCANAI